MSCIYYYYKDSLMPVSVLFLQGKYVNDGVTVKVHTRLVEAE